MKIEILSQSKKLRIKNLMGYMNLGGEMVIAVLRGGL